VAEDRISVGSCEHRNKALRSVEEGQSVDYLMDYLASQELLH
jgi:hypothetical protein